MDLKTIDWNKLWQEESAHSHWHRTSRDDAASKALWDKRADTFTQRINRVKDNDNNIDQDDYIGKMLARIEVSPESTILDIGCGPGTLTIPLAKKAKNITALDISCEMLKHLKKNAARNGIKNISYINSSWDDAFASNLVGMHDIVIASRSLGATADIIEMLGSVDSVAGEAVYLTFPVIHLPFDWEVYKAIGRGDRKHPSYIYIVNALYQMGIQVNVEILHSRVRVQFSSIADAIDDLQWRTDPFTPQEKEKLITFLESKFAQQQGSPQFTHEGKSLWALIWWRK